MAKTAFFVTTLEMEKKGQKWPICTVKVRLKKMYNQASHEIEMNRL